jgi:hypothetical protein
MHQPVRRQEGGYCDNGQMRHWISFLDAPRRITNIQCETCHWVREHPWGEGKGT